MAAEIQKGTVCNTAQQELRYVITAGKKGHYARVCRNKKLCVVSAAVVNEATDLSSMSAGADDSPWMTDIKVDKYNTAIKTDTGADVTTIPETLYDKDQFGGLKKPKRVLQGPGGTFLKVNGMFTAAPSKNSKSTTEDIYVIQSLYTPLLSKRAAMALEVVTSP